MIMRGEESYKTFFFNLGVLFRAARDHVSTFVGVLLWTRFLLFSVLLTTVQVLTQQLKVTYKTCENNYRADYLVC